MAISPAHIIQLSVGFWGPKTLLSAVELGVFTELATGPLAAEPLRERLRLHHPSLAGVPPHASPQAACGSRAPRRPPVP
jgi:hypothetical protein